VKESREDVPVLGLPTIGETSVDLAKLAILRLIEAIDTRDAAIVSLIDECNADGSGELAFSTDVRERINTRDLHAMIQEIREFFDENPHAEERRFFVSYYSLKSDTRFGELPLLTPYLRRALRDEYRLRWVEVRDPTSMGYREAEMLPALLVRRVE
jgi:hypothetical protein